MEDTLRAVSSILSLETWVLILVLMEDTLRDAAQKVAENVAES